MMTIGDGCRLLLAAVDPWISLGLGGAVMLLGVLMLVFGPKIDARWSPRAGSTRVRGGALVVIGGYFFLTGLR
jgi:uncharacterized membrane protein YedE/YeeE